MTEINYKSWYDWKKKMKGRWGYMYNGIWNWRTVHGRMWFTLKKDTGLTKPEIFLAYMDMIYHRTKFYIQHLIFVSQPKWFRPRRCTICHKVGLTKNMLFHRGSFRPCESCICKGNFWQWMIDHGYPMYCTFCNGLLKTVAEYDDEFCPRCSDALDRHVGRVEEKMKKAAYFTPSVGWTDYRGNKLKVQKQKEYADREELI